MAERRNWTREELIVTLSLYFQLPFGRLNHSTPEVRELARIIGRTDNSVALRLVNFAACDPYILNSGRHGMSSGVNVCKPIWDEYCNDHERLFLEAEAIKAKMLRQPIEERLGITESDLQGTTKEAVVKQRVNQDVFRTMILNNYDNTCAITGINIPTMLIASHIIPWADDEENRLNPENGICLSPLYDKAFDKGFIGIDEDYRVVLSRELKEYSTREYYQQHFGSIEHKKIILPEEHKPNLSFLEYHINNIFAKHN
jgi:putative restriction endonuclease